MSPMTLRSLERGSAGVTMGACLAVMQVLGIEDDLDLVAKTDVLGRELQDARLPARHRSAVFTTHPSLDTRPTQRTRTDLSGPLRSEQSPKAVGSLSREEHRRKELESPDQIHAGSESDEQMRKTFETPEQMRKVIASLPEELPREELSNLGAHANELQKAVKDLETPAKELEKVVKDLETPAKELEKVVKGLEIPAKEIQKVLKDSEVAGVWTWKDLEAPAKELQKMMRDLEAPAKELQKMMRDLEAPARELQKMMRDLEIPGEEFQKMLKESEVAGERIRKSLLTSAELAKLIDVPPLRSKKRQ
jgi:prefoldin subunit 5